MAVSEDPAAAGRDRLRAGYAEREQVLDTLKGAFTEGRLTKAELDARVGQALAALTTAGVILIRGAAASVEQWRSRRRPRPLPGLGGPALEAE